MKTGTDIDSGAELPDGFTAVDEFLLAVPEPHLAPDRFAAMHAALVRELEQSAAHAPTRHKVRWRPPTGLRWPRATRWRVALSSAALGALAVALALEHTVGGGSPDQAHTPVTAASRLDAVLAASWTAPYTGLTGPAATAAQASCAAVYNADPEMLAHLSYSSYDHITDSTILMAGRQGQVIAVALQAGPIIVSCLEVPSGSGSGSWTAHPAVAVGSGYSDGKPGQAKLSPPSASTPLKTFVVESGLNLGPADAGDDGGSTTKIGLYMGSTTPDVAKVTAEVTDSSTGRTQDISQQVSAGTCFLWWPAQEGTWTRTTAYSSDGRVLSSVTPPPAIPMPTSRPTVTSN